MTSAISESNEVMTASLSNTQIALADSTLPPLPLQDPAATLANTVRRLCQGLQGPRMAIAVVPTRDMTADLVSGDAARSYRFASPERRRAWIAGRIAIKTARRQLGLCTNTSTLRFPNACTSLTHISGFAIAVAVPEGALRGVGVDLEVRRATTPRIERFFLTKRERAALARRPAHLHCDDRVRLWTVKEAVFKACPENHSLSLTSFEVENPAVRSGSATCRFAAPTDHPFANKIIGYASSWTPIGCMSLATMQVSQPLSPYSAQYLPHTARMSPAGPHAR